MLRLLYLTFILHLTCNYNVLAQDKFEKESRIKQKDVPIKALTFIDSLNFNVKVKWFKEEAINRKSIEAKFKLKKLKYSIEFDTIGNIEDIEVEINWQDLELNTLNFITKQIKLNCSKHKIVKIQKQFTGKENDLYLILKNDITSDKINLKYELIVKCKTKNKVNLYEYLFNDKAILISKSKIVFRNSSHLEY